MAASVKIFDISHSSLPWLKLNIIPTLDSIDTGLFPLKTPKRQQFFEFFQCCIPPICNVKYCNLKLENYYKDFDSDESTNKYLSITTSILLYNEQFGFQLLDYLNFFQNIDQTLDYPSDFIDDLMTMMNKAFHKGKKNSLEKDDLCSKSSEFLLEPSVLIQLPWKPVMFHQWLTIALSEILLFERDSIKLRHWPLSKELVSVATNLLSIIARLKERIMLGFAILNEATESYSKTLEKYERKYMESILSCVIVPSLPILELLTNGNAKLGIENIKRHQKSCLSTKLPVYNVPYHAYKIELSLEKLHSEFAYNFKLWTHDQVPTFSPLAVEKLSKIAPKLIIGPELESFTLSQYQPLSLDEINLFQLIKENKMTSMSDIIDIAVKVIELNIAKNDKIIKVTANEVENKLRSGNIELEDIFDVSKTDNVHLLLRYALMYNKADSLLSGWDANTSVATQLIAMQLDLLREEQLVRLTNILITMFNTFRPTINASEIVDSSIENLNTQIQELKIKVKKCNRKKFWAKFDKSWKQKVDPNEKFLPITPNNLDECVKEMLDRIGRLIFNHSFEFFKTDYDLDAHFEEITLVNYILPSFVYIFASNFKNNPANIIYHEVTKFIIVMLESAYLYLTEREVTKCQQVDYEKTPKKYIPVHQSQYTKRSCDLYSVCCALYRYANDTFHAASRKIKCDKFQRQLATLLQYMFDWNKYWMDNALNLKIPNTGEFKKDLIFAAMYNNSKYVCVFFTNLKNCLIAKYNVPHCKHTCKNVSPLFSKIPRLDELYFACAVLADLACIYDPVPVIAINQMSVIDKQNYRQVRHGLNWAVREIRIFVLSLTKNSLLYLDKDYVLDFKYLASKLLMLQVYYRVLVIKLEESKVDLFQADSYLPFSSSYPEVKRLVDYFVEGNYRQLDKFLKILNDESQVVESDSKFCRRCGKQENSATKKFIQCKKCIETKFPEMNYFCSKTCENIMMTTEHLAEHLEFELGLAKFSSCNLYLDEIEQSSLLK